MHPTNENATMFTNTLQSRDIDGEEQTSSPKRKIEQVDTFESETEKTSEKNKIFKGKFKAINVTQPKAEASQASNEQEHSVVDSETEETSEESIGFDDVSEPINATQPKTEASQSPKPLVEAVSAESETEKTSEGSNLVDGKSEIVNATRPKSVVVVADFETEKSKAFDGESKPFNETQPESVVVDSETEKTEVFDGKSEAISDTQSKTEVTQASKPQVKAVIVASKESVKDVKEDLNSSLEGAVSDSNNSAIKIKNKDLTDHAKSTGNGASEPEKPKVAFGQTYNDPKYSWLSSFGKSTLGSNALSLKTPTNTTAIFQGFKTSTNPSLDDKGAKAVDFDALLMKAKDTEQSKPEPTVPKLQLIDEAVSTGEEDEETLFEATGKLHVLGKDMKWTERGVGQLKINALRSDIFNRRIIMRLESVHKVILNVKVVPDLKPTAEGKFVRFSAFETEGSPSSFTFRTSAADIAEWMVEEMTY